MLDPDIDSPVGCDHFSLSRESEGATVDYALLRRRVDLLSRVLMNIPVYSAQEVPERPLLESVVKQLDRLGGKICESIPNVTQPQFLRADDKRTDDSNGKDGNRSEVKAQLQTLAFRVKYENDNATNGRKKARASLNHFIKPKAGTAR